MGKRNYRTWDAYRTVLRMKLAGISTNEAFDAVGAKHPKSPSGPFLLAVADFNEFMAAEGKSLSIHLVRAQGDVLQAQTSEALRDTMRRIDRLVSPARASGLRETAEAGRQRDLNNAEYLLAQFELFRAEIARLPKRVAPAPNREQGAPAARPAVAPKTEASPRPKLQAVKGGLSRWDARGHGQRTNPGLRLVAGRA